MPQEKVRVYALARELDMESKALLEMCRQAGFDVKNQLSSLEPDQRDMIEALIRKGSRGGTAVAPPPPPAQLPRDITGKVRVLPPAGRPRTEAAPPAPPPPPPAAAPVRRPLRLRLSKWLLPYLLLRRPDLLWLPLLSWPIPRPRLASSKKLLPRDR